MLPSDDSAFFKGSPFRHLRWLLLCSSVALLGLGCTPKIGDECTVSTNCSTAGDRLCDITQPGGYCTVFNCEPGTCPADSACINFGTTLSALEQCAPSQGNSPYQRSFCMARCGSDADCRAGYKCLNLSGGRDAQGNPTNFLGAVLAEESGSGTVCAVMPSPAPTLDTHSNEVCRGSAGGGGSSGAAGSGTSNTSGSSGDGSEEPAAGASGSGG